MILRKFQILQNIIAVSENNRWNPFLISYFTPLTILLNHNQVSANLLLFQTNEYDNNLVNILRLHSKKITARMLGTEHVMMTSFEVRRGRDTSCIQTPSGSSFRNLENNSSRRLLEDTVVEYQPAYALHFAGNWVVCSFQFLVTGFLNIMLFIVGNGFTSTTAFAKLICRLKGTETFSFWALIMVFKLLCSNIDLFLENETVSLSFFIINFDTAYLHYNFEDFC